MDARVIDLATNEGLFAARRMAARSNTKPSDQEEVIVRAGGRLEWALTQWGYGQAVIGDAGAMMVETYMAELARLTGGQAHV